MLCLRNYLAKEAWFVKIVGTSENVFGYPDILLGVTGFISIILYFYIYLLYVVSALLENPNIFNVLI